MRRVLLAGLVLALIGATLVAVAQPPAAPPATPPAVVVPPADSTSAPPRTLPATTPTPLSQFEPLTAFPQQTQAAVRGVLLGASWMGRMHQPQGRFLYAYNPALRQPLPGDHDLMQARGALA